MSRCACDGDGFYPIANSDPVWRPRTWGEIEICGHCGFSWGVKDE